VCGRQEADVAAAPLTVTSTRARVVDFTTPFWVDRIVVIMSKRHATQFDIHSVADLARQSPIRYCALTSGATKHFLQASTNIPFAGMWEEMAGDPTSWVHTVEEGLQRVVECSDEHPWAFVTQISVLSSVNAHLRCDMEVIDLDVQRFLSMALPFGSAYRDRLSLGILVMLESGELQKLRYKWWYDQSLDCDTSANGAAKRFLFSLH